MIAWQKTFVSTLIAQVFSIIGFSFAMPFLPLFIADLGISDKGAQAFWAGIVLGASGLTMAIFAPLWGVLADRYGRKLMVCRSMLGGALVLLLMSMTRTVGQLVFFRLLQGAFTGTIAASVALVAAVTPQHRSGFALGMMQAAVFVGVSLGPLFGGLVADSFGYRAAFRAGALIVLLGGLLAYFGIRENFTPPGAGETGNRPPGFRQIIGVSGFMTAVFVMFGVRLSNTIINPSFPLIVKEIIPASANLNSVTGAILAAAGVAGALSAAVLGFVGDQWGHRRILIACSFTAALASAGHFFAYSVPVLFSVQILFGLAVAGMLPAANAMIRAVIDDRCVGKAYGAATSLSVIGLALGPLAGGWIARMSGLRAPFLVTAAGQLLVVLLVVSVPRAGNNPVPVTSERCRSAVLARKAKKGGRSWPVREKPR